MKILFCRIMHLNYYKGVVPFHDQPNLQYSGLYVKLNGTGNEEYNFTPTKCLDGKTYCFGFVDTKMTRGRSRKVHIERIDKGARHAPQIDDVLVIWCAMTQDGLRIVGWYQHATVYREYHYLRQTDGELQPFIAKASFQNCVLLPVFRRSEEQWRVPQARADGFGFGQADLWYAKEQAASHYCEQLVTSIRHYDGDNWLMCSYKEVQR